MALWFDLSPMRPDEWARSDANRWNRNMKIRMAYEEGAREASDEAQAASDLANMPNE